MGKSLLSLILGAAIPLGFAANISASDSSASNSKEDSCKTASYQEFEGENDRVSKFFQTFSEKPDEKVDKLLEKGEYAHALSYIDKVEGELNGLSSQLRLLKEKYPALESLFKKTLPNNFAFQRCKIKTDNETFNKGQLLLDKSAHILTTSDWSLSGDLTAYENALSTVSEVASQYAGISSLTLNQLDDGEFKSLEKRISEKELSLASEKDGRLKFIEFLADSGDAVVEMYSVDFSDLDKAREAVEISSGVINRAKGIISEYNLQHKETMTSVSLWESQRENLVKGIALKEEELRLEREAVKKAEEAVFGKDEVENGLKEEPKEILGVEERIKRKEENMPSYNQALGYVKTADMLNKEGNYIGARVFYSKARELLKNSQSREDWENTLNDLEGKIHSNETQKRLSDKLEIARRQKLGKNGWYNFESAYHFESSKGDTRAELSGFTNVLDLRPVFALPKSKRFNLAPIFRAEQEVLSGEAENTAKINERSERSLELGLGLGFKGTYLSAGAVWQNASREVAPYNIPFNITSNASESSLGLGLRAWTNFLLNSRLEVAYRQASGNLDEETYRNGTLTKQTSSPLETQRFSLSGQVSPVESLTLGLNYDHLSKEVRRATSKSDSKSDILKFSVYATPFNLIPKGYIPKSRAGRGFLNELRQLGFGGSYSKNRFTGGDSERYSLEFRYPLKQPLRRDSSKNEN